MLFRSLESIPDLSCTNSTEGHCVDVDHQATDSSGAEYVDRQAHLLRCPSCGATRRLPGYPLFVVTGASGAGKSTIVEPLRRRLPDCEVFEADIILHVAALGWDTWRNTWLQLTHAIALNGRATVLCGSLLPDSWNVYRPGGWSARSTSATLTAPMRSWLSGCALAQPGATGRRRRLSSTSASPPGCGLRCNRPSTPACSAPRRWPTTSLGGSTGCWSARHPAAPPSPHIQRTNGSSAWTKASNVSRLDPSGAV